MVDDIFEIKPCPLCGESHKYLLSVQRSKYLYGMNNTTPGHTNRIKRLFACPKSNEFFEAMLILPKDDLDLGSIESIKVDGIIEEADDGTEK